MISSHKQPIKWLIGLIALITAISYLTVYLIPASYPLITNGALVSGLVIGVLLLSLFTHIQNGEYAYPRWCVFIIAILLSISCQLLIQYWQPLLIKIIGLQNYWTIMAQPIHIYLIIGWALLAILLLITTCSILLKLTRPFAILGFYQLSPLTILIAFSAWTIALDCYLTPTLLQSLSFQLANQLSITDNNHIQWLYKSAIAALILIKIITAIYYRERCLEQVQRLLWISITIWLIILLADMALITLNNLLLNYINSGAIIATYYLLIAMISVLIFQLYLKQ